MLLRRRRALHRVCPLRDGRRCWHDVGARRGARKMASLIVQQRVRHVLLLLVVLPRSVLLPPAAQGVRAASAPAAPPRACGTVRRNRALRIAISFQAAAAKLGLYPVRPERRWRTSCSATCRTPRSSPRRSSRHESRGAPTREASRGAWRRFGAEGAGKRFSSLYFSFEAL